MKVKEIIQWFFGAKKTVQKQHNINGGTAWFKTDDLDEADALATLAIKKAGFKRSDFFKPARVDHLIVDDMPAREPVVVACQNVKQGIRHWCDSEGIIHDTTTETFTQGWTGEGRRRTEKKLVRTIYTPDQRAVGMDKIITHRLGGVCWW